MQVLLHMSPRFNVYVGGRVNGRARICVCVCVVFGRRTCDSVVYVHASLCVCGFRDNWECMRAHASLPACG